MQNVELHHFERQKPTKNSHSSLSKSNSSRREMTYSNFRENYSVTSVKHQSEVDEGMIQFQIDLWKAIQLAAMF